jgi:hypothetical protein
MNTVLDLLVDHGAAFLAGLTAILGLGALACVASRSPAHQQRTGELAIAGALVFMALALTPLPRWVSGDGDSVRGTQGAGAWADARADASSDREDASRRETMPSTPPSPHAPVPVPDALPTISTSTTDGALQAPGPSAPRVGSAPPMGRLAHTGDGVVDALDPERQAPGQDRGSAGAFASSSIPTHDDGAAIPWRRVLGASYLAAVFLCAAFLALGFIRLRATIACGIESPELEPAPTHGRRIRVLTSPEATRPFCWGLWRPTIVIPSSLRKVASDDSLRHVVLHEIAHLRRGDLWGHLLCAAALPFLFFHPIYWWLKGRVRLSAELAADAWAAGHSDPHTYARELVELAAVGLRNPSARLGVSLLGRRTELTRRIHMLLKRNDPSSLTLSRMRQALQSVAAVAVVVLAAMTWGVPLVEAQEPGPLPPATRTQEPGPLPPAIPTQVPGPLPPSGPLPGARPTPPPHRGAGPLPPSRAGFDPVAPRPNQPKNAVGDPFGVATIEDVTEETIEEATEEILEDVTEEFRGLGSAGNPAAGETTDAIQGKIDDLKRRLQVLENQNANLNQDHRQRTPDAGIADQTSIIDLVSHAIDLRFELEMALERVNEVRALAEAAAVSQHELRQAEFRLKALERKFEAVQVMVRTETKIAQGELSVVADRMKQPDTDLAKRELGLRLLRLQGRLEVLERAR